MSLDIRFGETSPADGDINPAELSYQPASLQKLEAETKQFLEAYIHAAEGLRTPQIVHQYCALLWIVDAHGDIHFALEELVDEHTGKTVAIRPKGDFGKIPGTVKLGHPSLLADSKKEARIGGEIVFNAKTGEWEINNFSGRYGFRDQADPSHLQEAAQIFKDIGGIVLKPVFR